MIKQIILAVITICCIAFLATPDYIRHEIRGIKHAESYIMLW